MAFELVLSNPSTTYRFPRLDLDLGIRMVLLLFGLGVGFVTSGSTFLILQQCIGLRLLLVSIITNYFNNPHVMEFPRGGNNQMGTP